MTFHSSVILFFFYRNTVILKSKNENLNMNSLFYTTYQMYFYTANYERNTATKSLYTHQNFNI